MRFRRFPFHLCLAILLLALAINPKPAAAKNWTDGTGFWSLGSNWSGGLVPAPGEAVNIVFTDGAPRTVTFNVASLSVGLLTVDLTGPVAPSASTLSMLSNSNNLTANGILVGGYSGITASVTAGRGALTQAGGTLTTNPGWDVVMGYGAGSTGVYTLSGGAMVANQSEYIGLSGNGTVTQSAGTNSVTSNGAFILGLNSGSTGTYNLSGTGSLTVNTNVRIGDVGTGIFIQTGGTHTITFIGGAGGGQRSLYLGYTVGGAGGTYNLSAGSLEVVTGNEFIGYNSNGTFTQSGGSNTIEGGFTLSIGGASAAATGTYTLSAGTLAVTGNEYVGILGSGYFDQSGGTHTVTGGVGLSIARLGGSTGQFALSGGSILVNSNVYVGGDGVGPGGTATLNVSGTGILTIGGTLVVYNGNIVNQFGGTINTPALNFNSTPSLYNWTAGTLNITSNITWDSAAAGTTTPAAFGPSLTLGAGKTLKITGNETLGGSGSFDLSIASGGAHNVTGNITLPSTGTLYLFPGHTLTYSTFIQSGGVINGDLHNTGTFTFLSGIFNDRFFNQGTVDFGSITAENGIENDTAFNVNSGQLITANGTGLFNYGTVTFAGGTLAGDGALINFSQMSGIGTIAGTAGFINVGLLTPTPTLHLANTGSNVSAGTIQLAFGSQLQLAAAAALSNSGFIDLNLGSITGPGTLTNASDGVITGPGVISAPFVNAGLLVAASGILTTPSFTNTGIIELASAAGKIAGGVVITNNATVEGRGQINAALINNATLEAVGGTLIVAGSLINNAAGTLRATLGNKILITGPIPGNDGIIALAGGTFDTNNQPLLNNGSITGFGLLATGGLTNNAAITFTGGTATITGPVTNNAGKTINIKFQPAIFTGNITNNGTIKTTATTVTFMGTYTGNAYISDPSTNIFQSDVTINSGGSMTGGVGDVFNFSGGNFTNNGAFANAGSLISSDPSTNNGTFTQSGPQTWSNGTTFTNNAGTASFATNTGSNSTSPLSITINAGIITFTATQHLNALTFAGTPNNWTGKLDLTNKSMIIVTGGGTANIPNQIKQAAHLGAWNGPAGITSSSAQAAAATSAATALAYATGSQFTAGNGQTSFQGMTFNPADTLVMYTLAADANMDTHVTFADFLQLQNHYNQTGTDWEGGDWNYDNSTTFSDFLILQNNYNKTLPAGPLMPATTPIPEPASILLLAPLLLLRKCRRASCFR